MAMLGIWFNNDDFSVRGNKYDDLELLMRSGFTDLFILIKGVSDFSLHGPAVPGGLASRFSHPRGFHMQR